MGAKQQVTVSKPQLLPPLTFFLLQLLPSNSSNWIRLSNEVHPSDLAQGLNPGACLTLGSLGQQNRIYYRNCSLAMLLFLQFSFFPAIFELSKRHADLKPAAYQILLSSEVVWKHRIFSRNVKD